MINTHFDNYALNYFKSSINKTLNSFYHDEFLFTNCSYGRVYFEIDNKLMELNCEQVGMIYFSRDLDEVSLFSIKQNVDHVELLTNLQTHKRIINQKITKIQIINEIQTLINEDNLKYKYEVTYGLAITLENGDNIIVNKPSYFGEEIEIYFNYDLNKVLKYLEKEYLDSFDDNCKPSIEFNIITIE